MSPLAANIVGFAGSAVFVGGYAYSNIAARPNFVLFNALNLVGAILLILSLTVEFNLPAMVLEIIWGTIALLGLIHAWRKAARA